MQKKTLFTILSACLLFLAAEAPPPITVKVEFEAAKIPAEKPIVGTIIVIHPSEEEIDKEAFFLGNEPLSVEREEEHPLPQALGAAPWQMTTFTFTLPPYKEGLHLLPPIFLRHEGDEYRSSRAGFQVVQAEQPPAIPAPPAKEPIFLLEAAYEGPTPLFPGLRGFLVYRIYFNRSVVLTKEVLPLLTPEGFRRVGDVEIREAETDGLSLQELRLQIEAKRPGVFSLGASRLEGLIEETGETLFSEAPSLSIVVVPLPSRGRSQAFSGAIGEFSFQVEPKSPTTVNVGDPIELVATIGGEGNLADVTFPSLFCQPGFSGLFRVAISPKGTASTPSERAFQITLRPLASFLQAIPPISFAFFSPTKREYVTLTQPSIPIEVNPSPPPFLAQPEGEAPSPPQKGWIAASLSPFPSLSEEDLYRPFWATSRVFILLPFGILFLYLQYLFVGAWQRRKGERIRESDRLFREASKNLEREEVFFGYFLAALQKRIEEVSPDKGRELLDFAKMIERERYGEGRELLCREIWKQWKLLR